MLSCCMNMKHTVHRTSCGREYGQGPGHRHSHGHGHVYTQKWCLSIFYKTSNFLKRYHYNIALKHTLMFKGQQIKFVCAFKIAAIHF
jgi:hypothetical protein